MQNSKNGLIISIIVGLLVTLLLIAAAKAGGIDIKNIIAQIFAVIIVLMFFIIF